MPAKRKPVEFIDQFILFFMILFLATLTNSIFLNQLGYYGALVLLLVKYFITEDNPFEKTGLESALLWFIAAEIFSLIFSLNHSQSLLFATRRFLLMPLIYVTLAAVPDLKRAKLYFNTYIITAVLTALVYIAFSYEYFISNLYHITESGPSLFQYPITSSEILGITSVFLFAFLINEKGELKNKLLVAAGLFITIIALVATYKRTGWLGAGFGFFLIILLKKEWKYLIPLIILVAALFLYEKNISQIKIFTINNKLIATNSFRTDGRAYDLTAVDGNYFVSDYEDGIIEYRGSRILNRIETPSPVVSLEKWDGFLLGYFVDTRFISYKLVKNSGLKQIAECLPPGLTVDHSISGEFLYTLDKDSGLTIFKDPALLEQIYRNTAFHKFYRVFADSGLLVMFSADNGLQVMNRVRGIPGKILYKFIPGFTVNSVFYLNSTILFSKDNGIEIYKAGRDSLHFVKEVKGPERIFLWKLTNNKLAAADESGNLYVANADSLNDFRLLGNPGFIPSSVLTRGDTLIASYVKRSRLLSMWDPYLPSNAVRLSLWKAGWKIFLDHPVFGVGDIDLAFLYKQYKSKYEKEIQGHMHNNFVHILVTLGLFGFLAFCYLLFRLFKIDLKIYKEVKNVAFASSYALGTIAALSTVVIAGLTEMNFFDHEIMTLLWFTFGLNVAVYKYYKDKIS